MLLNRFVVRNLIEMETHKYIYCAEKLAPASPI